MTVGCTSGISLGGHHVPSYKPDLQVPGPMGGVGQGRVVEHWFLIIAVGPGFVVVWLYKHLVSLPAEVGVLVGQHAFITQPENVSTTSYRLKNK